MILVTVGTNETPFDRLLEAVDQQLTGELRIVQHGPSHVRPAGAACVDFLPFDRLVELVRRARVVITHAGVGSIMVALANQQRPVVVARLRRFGEAVDDHQLPFAERFERAGLVTLVRDSARLAEAVAELDGSRVPAASAKGLSEDLHRYLNAEITGRARVAAPH